MWDYAVFHSPTEILIRSGISIVFIFLLLLFLVRLILNISVFVFAFIKKDSSTMDLSVKKAIKSLIIFLAILTLWILGGLIPRLIGVQIL